jgi:predicted RecA/RadA family phage recombinase
MAKNRVFADDRSRYLPVPEGTKSGDPVLFGQRPGVALTDRDSKGKATIDFGGCYELEVEAKNKAGEKAIAEGDIIFLTGKVLNVNNEEGVRFGYAEAVVEKGKKAKIRVSVGY